jgi:hypothetical protein
MLGCYFDLESPLPWNIGDRTLRHYLGSDF